MNKLRPSAFAMWLDAQPSTARFRGKSCNTCPLARFLGSDTVGLWSYVPAGKTRRVRLPVWATRFVEAFDAAVKRRVVGAAYAKKIFLKASVRRV
jgi:hypothetical protein